MDSQMQDIRSIVSQAMSFLGSKKSPAKTEAVRRNASKPPRKGSKPRGRPMKERDTMTAKDREAELQIKFTNAK